MARVRLDDVVRTRQHTSTDGTECLLCAVRLAEPESAQWVELSYDLFVYPAGDCPFEESQGGFPVGDGCYRRLVKAWKAAQS